MRKIARRFEAASVKKVSAEKKSVKNGEKFVTKSAFNCTVCEGQTAQSKYSAVCKKPLCGLHKREQDQPNRQTEFQNFLSLGTIAH